MGARGPSAKQLCAWTVPDVIEIVSTSLKHGQFDKSLLSFDMNSTIFRSPRDIGSDADDTLSL